MRTRYFFLIPFLALNLCFSCRNKGGDLKPAMDDTSQTYFSVRQLVKDQIQTYYGQPFSLYRVSTLNDKTDSSVVNLLNMDWAPIYKAFLASDIGEVKYLGHYRFSAFDDNMTGNRVLLYEALEKTLRTRQLQLVLDPTNMRIMSVYIDVIDKGMQQRLLYIPMKIIQIQETESSWAGKKRNFRLEYRFLQ